MTTRKGRRIESDVAHEVHEARSRAGKGDDHGTYVGRTGPDDALDASETGADARSQQRR